MKLNLWRDRTEKNLVPLFWDLLDAVLYVLAARAVDRHIARHRKAVEK